MVDRDGQWLISHRTRAEERGEKPIEDGRRCVFHGQRFYTGEAEGPLRPFGQTTDEHHRCLDSTLGIVSGTVRLFFDRLQVRKEGSRLVDGRKHTDLFLSLEPNLEQHPPSIPMAWTGLETGERSEAIWGPRKLLASSRAKLVAFEGQITVEGLRALPIGANLTGRAHYRKAERTAELTLDIELKTSAWNDVVTAPADVESPAIRQRIFRDRRALLGIPLPKSRVKKPESLPGPGDAPKLILTESGGLRSAASSAAGSKSSKSDEPLQKPPTADYDEDAPQ
jgi:hypothetical protein